MHRIDGAGHVDHLFVAEDPATLRPPTEITPEIMNAFQEELATFIEWAGVVLAKGDNTQLKQALLAKFAGLDVAATKAGVQAQTYTAFTTTGAAGAFVLTPNPVLAAYTAGQRFRVKFHVAGNGADAINISGLGNKNLKQYDSTGAKVAAVIAANQLVDIEYDGVDVVLLDPLPPPSSAVVTGNFRNLIIYNDGVAPNSKLQVFADEIVLKDATGASKLVTGINVSPDITTIGAANGLDAGAETANTWYSVWVISNGVTTAGLLSASASAPTLPAGYTFKARVGWVRNDGSSNFLKFKQVNRRAQYSVPQVMASGAAGNISTPTWVAVAVGAFVPSSAGVVYIGLQRNGASGQVMVASNNGFGAINSNGAPQPPINDNDTSAGTSRQFQGTLVLETSNLYWASAGASNYLMCQGWEDV